MSARWRSRPIGSSTSQGTKATRLPHQELARHFRYLKTENQILRSKLPKRTPVTLRNGTGWSGSARSWETPSAN